MPHAGKEDYDSGADLKDSDSGPPYSAAPCENPESSKMGFLSRRVGRNGTLIPALPVPYNHSSAVPEEVADHGE